MSTFTVQDLDWISEQIGYQMIHHELIQELTWQAQEDFEHLLWDKADEWAGPDSQFFTLESFIDDQLAEDQ